MSPDPRTDTIPIAEKDWPRKNGWNRREPTELWISAWIGHCRDQKATSGRRSSVYIWIPHGFSKGFSKSTILFLHPGRSEKKVDVAGKNHKRSRKRRRMEICSSPVRDLSSTGRIPLVVENQSKKKEAGPSPSGGL